MKLKIFTMISIVTVVISIFFNACTPPKGLYYQSINVLPIYQDVDNKLYFSYANGDYYSFDGVSLKQRSLYLFNDENKTWEKIAIKDSENITILSEDYNNTKLKFLYRTLTSSMVDENMVSTQESISYEGNVVKLTNIDTNEVVFTDTLPTKEEVINATGIDLYNSSIRYTPRMGGQFYWDKENYYLTACINLFMDELNVYGECDNVYAFSLLKDEDTTWHIENLSDYNLLSSYEHEKRRYWYLYDYTYINRQYFQISVIAPIDTYNDMIQNIYSSTVNIAYNATFDEQGNMHLFYNKKEDIKNENYDYFWYGYFTKENPTTALYEQKIPWEK